jgi:hypothetical protein
VAGADGVVQGGWAREVSGGAMHKEAEASGHRADPQVVGLLSGQAGHGPNKKASGFF